MVEDILHGGVGVVVIEEQSANCCDLRIAKLHKLVKEEHR